MDGDSTGIYGDFHRGTSFVCMVGVFGLCGDVVGVGGDDLEDSLTDAVIWSKIRQLWDKFRANWQARDANCKHSVRKIHISPLHIAFTKVR